MSELLSLVLFLASIAIYAWKAGRNKWWFAATLAVLGLFVVLNITLYASDYFTGDGVKGWAQRRFFAGTGQVPIDQGRRREGRGFAAPVGIGHLVVGAAVAHRPQVVDDRVRLAPRGLRQVPCPS